MSSLMIFFIVAFNLGFAALPPLSSRLCLYSVMQQAFAEDPLISERLSCRHAGGQIPLMQMRVSVCESLAFIDSERFSLPWRR